LAIGITERVEKGRIEKSVMAWGLTGHPTDEVQMRKRESKGGVSVKAFSGTNVVLLGFDTSPSKRKNLLGFALHRTDHTENHQYWLRGYRTFEATAPNPAPGTFISTLEHPIQDFSWGDYTAKPGHKYTYKIVPLYGSPENIKHGPEVEITIETMNEDLGQHAIYFNRGVAGSQAYARKFGNIRPDEISDPKKQKEAFKWLSRGLEEAILKFIGQAKGKDYALRAAVYEFSHAPVLEAFGKAAKKADVKIVYDRRKRGPYEATEKAAKTAGITKLMIPRTVGSAISHNKFIVLLHKGKPVQVWTGSTNFTEGGIFGQSNVGHIIRDEKLAQDYFDYWTRLSEDPDFKPLREANSKATPDPKGAPKRNSVRALFSPRPDLTALEWYGERMDAAKQFVGFTAAFGISSTLVPTLMKKKDYLRFIMVESEGSRRKKKATPENPKPKSQYEIFTAIDKLPNNRTAVGSVLNTSEDDAVGGELHHWLDESLTGLNDHVQYLHTKYMFLDAMTNNPTVISGSANFSEASTQKNDENMVIVQGNTDVADIFLGEFMRLFDHFYFRQIAQKLKSSKKGQTDKKFYLTADDSWTDRFFDKKSVKYQERKLFS